MISELIYDSILSEVSDEKIYIDFIFNSYFV